MTKSKMRKFALFFLLVSLFLSACGPTTRPSDLAINRTAQPAAQGSAPSPDAPIAIDARTKLILPLILRDRRVYPTPAPTGTAAPTSTPAEEASLSFAVIGDYGSGNQDEADVAALVSSWEPEFIITTGDNNYPLGEEGTIDAHVGQFYHTYIYPYTGDYGEGADQNRFFPSLGNHDWYTAGAQPYLDYFTLPGNERYYDFTWGPVHFFALNSDWNEPDGIRSDSQQAAWLQEKLAQSTSPWRIVYFHVAPYSSGMHGGTDVMQWPFKEWGADAVLTGHDHTYERLLIDGLPYFVNGVGGGAIYQFEDIVEGSQVRYNENYGAMLVEATQSSMTFNFISVKGEVIDAYTIEK